MVASPYIIELRHGLFDDNRIIGKDARLEVALVCGFHADAGTCQVRTANIHFLAVEHDHLKVDSWAEYSLQSVIKYWIAVKVGTEVRSWLLGMNEPHLHTATDE